jgi:hypothetical protein
VRSQRRAAGAASRVNPLLDVLVRAARGDLPAEDGSVEVLPAPPGRADAVVAFTAHHFVVADIDEQAVLAQIPPGSLSATMTAAFLVWLGDRIGSEPGSLDVFLVANRDDSFGECLDELADLDHPRVRRARDYRDDVRVFRDVDGAGIVTIGRGLAGRWEATFEVEPECRNRGVGRRLARASRALVPDGQPLFAQVAPGNAASLRAALAAGFRPLGAEVLFLRR